MRALAARAHPSCTAAWPVSPVSARFPPGQRSRPERLRARACNETLGQAALGRRDRVLRAGRPRDGESELGAASPDENEVSENTHRLTLRLNADHATEERGIGGQMREGEL